MMRMIDEKHGVIDVVFLTKFLQELLCQCRRSRCKQPYVQEIVCAGIGRSIQPELLAVDSDHCLVKCNVIRTRVAGRL